MTVPRVGQMFGPYQLQALMGVGGMGEVYRARDTTKGRVVALKLLRPELAVDPGFRERFRRESRVAAQLHEPHIIPVHDFGEIDGVLYIDMRLVDGLTLKDVLAQQGPLGPGRVAAIISQVGAALDAAHHNGLTHRDVKPENVLLTGDDFAYLVDFGIARAGGDSGLTSAGSAIGSCAYMAPERFTDGTVGPPADVYSLACLLYELLTGAPPFPTGDLTRLMSAHLTAPPPRPSALRPDIHPAFDDVVTWGMAKDPAHRCPSAGALAHATTAAATATPAAAAAVPTAIKPIPPQHLSAKSQPRSRPRTSVVLGLTGALAFIALGTLAWLALDAPDPTSAGTPSTAAAQLDATSSVRTPTTRRVSTTAQIPRAGLPGSDAQGFRDHPGARCDSGQTPVALGLTGQSALVICQTSSGALLYRGVRLSDNAGIELSHAQPTGDGFDVVNPNDGTRYQIRATTLTIVTAEGEVYTERMEQYASTL